jgi:hypothetical protein
MIIESYILSKKFIIFKCIYNKETKEYIKINLNLNKKYIFLIVAAATMIVSSFLLLHQSLQNHPKS